MQLFFFLTQKLHNLFEKIVTSFIWLSSIGTSDFCEKVINLNVCKHFSYGAENKNHIYFRSLYFFMMMAKILDGFTESSLVASAECSHSFISGSAVA